jgi:hypothetical protein
MSRHAFVSQPDKFRHDGDVPDWIWFPNLRLILGWGHGLWETLANRLMGVRHVFFLLGDGPRTGPAIEGLMDCRQRHFDFSPLQGIEPPLLVEATGRPVTVRYRMGDIGRAEPAPVHCPGGLHVIVPDGEYAVRHGVADEDPALALCRRERTLKPQFQTKLAELGLRYESGVGKRDVRPDGQRTPPEQAFAEWVARYKHAFIARRTAELMKDEAARPADFAAMRAAHVRARTGAIQRRKRDGKGVPHRPYKEEDLLRRTCGEVARREATAMMFDARWHEIAVLTAGGFVTRVP